MKKIYVAGGMREKELVSSWMDKLRAAGFEITCDWTVSETNGYDSDLTHEQASKYASDDLKGVTDADVVWHIVADYEGSRGAYVEVGAAIIGKKLLFVSGPTWRKSIFHHLAAAQFDTHKEAFEQLIHQRVALVGQASQP